MKSQGKYSFHSFYWGTCLEKSNTILVKLCDCVVVLEKGEMIQRIPTICDRKKSKTLYFFFFFDSHTQTKHFLLLQFCPVKSFFSSICFLSLPLPLPLHPIHFHNEFLFHFCINATSNCGRGKEGEREREREREREEERELTTVFIFYFFICFFRCSLSITCQLSYFYIKQQQQHNGKIKNARENWRERERERERKEECNREINRKNCQTIKRKKRAGIKSSGEGRRKKSSLESFLQNDIGNFYLTPFVPLFLFRS